MGLHHLKWQLNINFVMINQLCRNLFHKNDCCIMINTLQQITK